MHLVKFINNYKDSNWGITIMGIKGLGKIESSRKKSPRILRSIKNIQIN